MDESNQNQENSDVNLKNDNENSLQDKNISEQNDKDVQKEIQKEEKIEKQKEEIEINNNENKQINDNTIKEEQKSDEEIQKSINDQDKEKNNKNEEENSNEDIQKLIISSEEQNKTKNEENEEQKSNEKIQKFNINIIDQDKEKNDEKEISNEEIQKSFNSIEDQNKEKNNKIEEQDSNKETPTPNIDIEIKEKEKIEKNEQELNKIIDDSNIKINESININKTESFNSSKVSSPEKNRDKEDLPQIKGDEENELNSSKNLFYLGNLFRDVVNKYEKEDYKGSRQLLRNTITKKRNENSGTIEENQFDFNNIFNAQLNEVKQNTLIYLETAKEKLEIKYTNYIKNINDYISKNELKISKVLPHFEENENFMDYADDTIFKIIDNLLEIHDNIFSALEDHINLLYTFLDQVTLIQNKNPIEYFINNNSAQILNCWFLNKINYDKLNLSNVILNKDLSDLFSGYLCKKEENNFKKLSVQKYKDGKLSRESEFFGDHINKLIKLKIKSLPGNEINDLVNKKKKQQEGNKDFTGDYIIIGQQLRNLSIDESDFSMSDLPKFNLPVLKKVKIKKSKISLNYFFDSLVEQTSSLKEINIQNCKFNDKNIYDFFTLLSKKQYLQNSLQILGFSGNEITYFNLNSFINKGGILKSLNYLDLSKNDIYDFNTENFKDLPSLKVLDLSDNNISNYLFFDAIKNKYRKKQMGCIVLLSNNIFISNNKKNNHEYRKYIYQCLNTFNYRVRKISLSLLYSKDNNEELINLKISPAVKISVIKLNLSFCGLKAETVWKFLHNNYGLLNLVSLNLSNNFVTNYFFVLCVNTEILLDKLKIIDLSMNEISCKNMEELTQLEKFMNNYINLKRIKIQDNIFTKELDNLYKKDKDNITKVIDTFANKEIKFEVGSDLYASINEKLLNIIIFKNKNN